jgi:hypothetical protein
MKKINLKFNNLTFTVFCLAIFCFCDKLQAVNQSNIGVITNRLTKSDWANAGNVFLPELTYIVILTQSSWLDLAAPYINQIGRNAAQFTPLMREELRTQELVTPGSINERHRMHVQDAVNGHAKIRRNQEDIAAGMPEYLTPEEITEGMFNADGMPRLRRELGVLTSDKRALGELDPRTGYFADRPDEVTEELRANPSRLLLDGSLAEKYVDKDYQPSVAEQWYRMKVVHDPVSKKYLLTSDPQKILAAGTTDDIHSVMYRGNDLSSIDGEVGTRYTDRYNPQTGEYELQEWIDTPDSYNKVSAVGDSFHDVITTRNSDSGWANAGRVFTHGLGDVITMPKDLLAMGQIAAGQFTGNVAGTINRNRPGVYDKMHEAQGLTEMHEEKGMFSTMGATLETTASVASSFLVAIFLEPIYIIYALIVLSML